MRDQDELLRRYLLGELAEEEENLFEARLLQDDELFEGMEAMEADLLDEYAHGRLSPEESARIERRLASSPQGRLRLAVIRGLGKVAEEEANGRRVLPGPWTRKDLSRPSVRALAAAAMLAITVGSVWIGRQTAPTPTPPSPLPEDEIAGTPVPQPPSPVPTPVPAPLPPVIAATPTPAPLPFVFELALTTLRGDGDPVPELRVPSGAEKVDIHLPLIQGDEAYPSFQVVLLDPTGTELVRLANLEPVRLGDRAVLVLPVEAKDLRAGRHTVEVYGGEGKALAFPEFEIPKS